MIVDRAEKTNYFMGRIDKLVYEKDCVKFYFKKDFDANHFALLVQKVVELRWTPESISHLTRENLLSSFGLLERTLWYYNDHLKDNRYKIRNLYVLLSLLFAKLNDRNLKYLINKYNNIVKEVPLSGAVLISDDGRLLLVKNNFAKTWSFPKGKLADTETAQEAAVRECFEETGYDISNKIETKNVIVKKCNRRLIHLYVITNVPSNYEFKPQNQNEIAKVAWFPINHMLCNWREFNIYINRAYHDIAKLFN